ncbi:MAG TPA: MarR family transcriptional regulator [Solirubrobacteraceae bacterium]
MRGSASGHLTARTGADLLDQALALGRRIRVELGEHDLTIRQFQALRALAPAPLRLGQLAEAVEVRAPSAVALVDGLMAGGHVARRPDPADARASLIELTPGGRRVLRTAQAHVVRMLDHELAAGPAGDEPASRRR